MAAWVKYAGVAVLAAAVIGVSAVALTPPTAPASAGVAPGEIAEAADRPTAVFVGDSYTAGAGVEKGDRTSTLVANAMGWREVNLARGGTGYGSSVESNAEVACGLDYCPSYLEMIPEVVAAAPAVVVVNGGRNQAGGDSQELAAQIRQFYTDLRGQLPDAQIIAVSPVWDDDPAPTDIDTMRHVVRESVESVGGVFVDVGQPLAGHSDMILDDGIHPNAAGHEAIRAATLAVLKP